RRAIGGEISSHGDVAQLEEHLLCTVPALVVLDVRGFERFIQRMCRGTEPADFLTPRRCRRLAIDPRKRGGRLMTTSESELTQGAADIRDGMHIEWDVPIEMDDGIVLRADVFRPIEETPVPALVTYGPYCKGLRISDHHPLQWGRLTSDYPE